MIRENVIHVNSRPICPSGDFCETLDDPATGHRAACCQSIVGQRERPYQCVSTMEEMIRFRDAATGDDVYLCPDCAAWHFEEMCGRCQESVLAEIHAESRRAAFSGRGA